MPEQPCVIGVSGWSGSGKTRLIELLVREYRRRALRVACIKHAAHGATLDRRGSDSARMTAAGADAVLLCAPDMTALFRPAFEQPTLGALLGALPDVDVVLVEGYHDAAIPRIEVACEGQPMRAAPASLIAVVDEAPAGIPAAPVFGWDDAHQLADFALAAVRPRSPAPATT